MYFICNQNNRVGEHLEIVIFNREILTSDCEWYAIYDLSFPVSTGRSPSPQFPPQFLYFHKINKAKNTDSEVKDIKVIPSSELLWSLSGQHRFQIINIKYVQYLRSSLTQHPVVRGEHGGPPSTETVQHEMGKTNCQLGAKVAETESVINSQIVIWQYVLTSSWRCNMCSTRHVLTISMNLSTFVLFLFCFSVEKSAAVSVANWCSSTSTMLDRVWPFVWFPVLRVWALVDWEWNLWR